MPNRIQDEMIVKFGAVGAFFSGMANEKDVAALLDSVERRDAKSYQDIVNKLTLPKKYELPPRSRCAWISEMIEKTTSVPVMQLVYALKKSLSPEQLEQFHACLRDNPGTGTVRTMIGLGDWRDVVEDPNLLACLQKNDLVESVGSTTKWAARIFLWPERPSRFCYLAWP